MMRKYGKVEDRLRRLGARMKRIITTTVLVLFIIALPALGNLTEYQTNLGPSAKKPVTRKTTKARDFNSLA